MEVLRREVDGTVGVRAVAVAVFAVDVRTPARARQWLRARLAEWGLDGVTDSVELCTSELVTNALRYATANVHVLVTVPGSRVRVEVRDDDVGALPEARRPDPSAESGRGLGIVEALATLWGVNVDASRTRKTVWFELRLPPDDASI